MNNAPQRQIPNHTPTHTPARPPRRRRRNNILIIITVVLAVVLVFSASLNIALILSAHDDDTPAPSSTDGKTTAYTTDSYVNTTSAEDGTITDTEPAKTDESGVYEAEIAGLREMVKAYSDAANSGFSAQAGIYGKILDLLKIDSRPMRIQYREMATETEENSDKTESTADAGETTAAEVITVKFPANVAFAYLDLETGYTLSFNADEIMYSASLIKAPYIYSILKAVEEFENNKLSFSADGTALYDGDGNPLFEGEHPNLDENGKIIYASGEEKFDLSRKWVYDSATMFVEGSGNIQTEEDGFTLTYLELAEYALKYSDNIALEALAREFGYSYYNNLASSLGISGTSYGFMQLSADDCIKFLKEIYAYMETDSEYAAVMKKAMTEAPYNVMLPAAVSPLTCAHKYGWDIDAYHDMGIVYHERPFAIVVMTDLDEGRPEDYAYIQNIAKAILELHESFSPAEETADYETIE